MGTTKLISVVTYFLVNMLLVNCMDEDMKAAMDSSAQHLGIDPNNPKPGQMLFKPPELTEEEERSQFLPKAHRCDGCIAVAYQLEHKVFPNEEKKKKKGEKLKDSELIELTENLCNKGFENYGLKNMGRRNVLSGEGLEADKEAGMMEGGPRWQTRIQQLCKELVETFEEDGVYDLYRNKGDKKLSSLLCTDYCKGEYKRKITDEL